MTLENLHSSNKAALEKVPALSNCFCAESVRHNGATAAYRIIDYQSTPMYHFRNNTTAAAQPENSRINGSISNHTAKL